jgi:hypothetical protein
MDPRPPMKYGLHPNLSTNESGFVNIRGHLNPAAHMKYGPDPNFSAIEQDSSTLGAMYP